MSDDAPADDESPSENPAQPSRVRSFVMGALQQIALHVENRAHRRRDPMGVNRPLCAFAWMRGARLAREKEASAPVREPDAESFVSDPTLGSLAQAEVDQWVSVALSHLSEHLASAGRSRRKSPSVDHIECALDALAAAVTVQEEGPGAAEQTSDAYKQRLDEIYDVFSREGT